MANQELLIGPRLFHREVSSVPLPPSSESRLSSHPASRAIMKRWSIASRPTKNCKLGQGKKLRSRVRLQQLREHQSRLERGRDYLTKLVRFSNQLSGHVEQFMIQWRRQWRRARCAQRVAKWAVRSSEEFWVGC